MTVFRNSFDLFDILDVYSQPQRQLIPILALDNKRKQCQKRCNFDMKTSRYGNEGPSGAGADSDVGQNQKRQEFPDYKRDPHATKKAKVGNDDSFSTATTPSHSRKKRVAASSLSPSSFFSFVRNGGEQFMRVDIQENDSTYQFQVDLPGISRNKIDVDLDKNNLLTISARREKFEDNIRNAQEIEDSSDQKGKKENQTAHENGNIPENIEKTTDRETKIASNETENGPRSTTIPTTANAKAHNLNIDVDANANDESDKTTSKFLLRERLYGKMERVFHLGKEVDSDNVSASLESGVLKVTIPKVTRASPKKIEIN